MGRGCGQGARALGRSRLKLCHEQYCSGLRSLVCYARSTMANAIEAAYSLIMPTVPSIIVLAVPTLARILPIHSSLESSPSL